MQPYDVVIIGSGLGGLLCGNILSSEGMSVCVLEKNHTTGGCLQTFIRDGSRFDTGMHYAGSLDKGQFLDTLFSYLGIRNDLNLLRLEEDGYDVIRYGGIDYRLPMGYERFVNEMSRVFPSELKGLVTYSAMMKEVGDTISNFGNAEGTLNPEYFSYYRTCYDGYLNSCFRDEVLKNVLSGMSMLYGGVRERSPLYIPMMIHSSFINGAYRFIDGGSQLQDLLCKKIISNGGKIITEAEVTGFRTGDSGIISALSGKEETAGRYFISGIHPKKILALAGNVNFKRAYISRVNSLQETCGMFTLYLSSSSYGFPYVNRNFYCYNTGDVWHAPYYTTDTWPEGYMLHFTPVSGHPGHTNNVIVNTYMRWEEMSPWTGTKTGRRGKEYQHFKESRALKLLSLLKKDFPEITAAITSYSSSTPLTYRDYTGTAEGSAYGILKDCTRPFETMILPSTHIPNLLLTGQNINTHGAVGVSAGALMTCSEILGKQYLIHKIYNGR